MTGSYVSPGTYKSYRSVAFFHFPFLLLLSLHLIQLFSSDFHFPSVSSGFLLLSFLFLHPYSSHHFPLSLTNFFVAEWPVGAFLYLLTYPQCIAFSYDKPLHLASGFLISYSMRASTVRPCSQFQHIRKYTPLWSQDHPYNT